MRWHSVIIVQVFECFRRGILSHKRFTLDPQRRGVQQSPTTFDTLATSAQSNGNNAKHIQQKLLNNVSG